MRSSPDRNCGRFSKYLTSKIGDSKHDDDEKMQHKKLVPVHNMLRGYTFSGASAGDAISIMGTSAGDDNDMVGCIQLLSESLIPSSKIILIDFSVSLLILLDGVSFVLRLV
jgi:ABC-type histidine transport system ATPase subunit